VPLLPPVISLTSAVGGTATFTFTSDPGFPFADTTFWVLDPITGAVLFSFGPFSPPTAALPGLSVTATYTIIATTFDSGTSDFSAPSLPVTIAPQTWAGPGGGFKNVIHFSPKYGARSYQLIDQLSQAVLVDHPYPVFVDTQVFATEEAAQIFQYECKAVINDTPQGVTEVRRYRTDKTLCLVTGEVLELNGEPPIGQPTPVQFRMNRLNVPDTNRPRRRREVQRAYQTDFQVEAWPNYLGQWGAYLMSGSVVWVEIGDRRIEFAVPFSTTEELVDIAQIERSILPKRT
jgi:hypothetical protein